MWNKRCAVDHVIEKNNAEDEFGRSSGSEGGGDSLTDCLSRTDKDSAGRRPLELQFCSIRYTYWSITNSTACQTIKLNTSRNLFSNRYVQSNRDSKLSAFLRSLYKAYKMHVPSPEVLVLLSWTLTLESHAKSCKAILILERTSQL